MTLCQHSEQAAALHRIAALRVYIEECEIALALAEEFHDQERIDWYAGEVLGARAVLLQAEAA